MPGMYKPGDYDIAGFSLGIVENNSLLPKIDIINENDIVIGLPSNGIHSNGFSLIHKILDIKNLKLTDIAPFSSCNKTFGEELLTPTKIYVSAMKSILKSGIVKAIGHITGGGLIENIPRILPDSLGVILDAKKIHIPPVFGWIATNTNLTEFELLKTFNCGIGMILIVPESKKIEALCHLYGHDASVIGKVYKRSLKQQQVIVENFNTQIDHVQRNLILPKKKVGVLISGNGSNLQALINATQNSAMGMSCEICCVISNKPNVYGLERAKLSNIPSHVIIHKDYDTREEFDREITKKLEYYGIEIICLAGFMRILSKEFVKKWKGKLINIHPSLLPKHKGMNVQKKAIDAGDSISGCSVHFVDEVNLI